MEEDIYIQDSKRTIMLSSIEQYSSQTLSVIIPHSNAFESVNNKASTLRAAIRRQASCIVVVSGTVRAFDNRNRFTVLSPVSPLLQ